MTCMIIFSVLQSLLPNFAYLAEQILTNVIDNALDVLKRRVDRVRSLFLFVEEGIAGDGGGG